MADLSVPPTPRNYELWFAHVTGEVPELSKLIDGIVASGRRPTPSELADLHEAFFTSQVREAKLLTDLGDKLAKQISGVMTHIESAGAQTQAYGQALGAAHGKLATAATDQTALKAVVDTLVNATHAMEQRTKTLEAKLHESKTEVTALRTSIETIRKEARTDTLTGLANRKCFDEFLRGAVKQAHDSGEPLCLLMADIDHFKRFNDTYGHQTGDQVLRLVAQCLRDSVKGRDLSARYGGEEFAVVLPQTQLGNAVHLANQIRVLVESKKLVKKSTGEDLGTITLSLGAAKIEPGEAPGDLIERADACLYAAKRSGRNRVISETDVDVDKVLKAAAQHRAAKAAAA